MTVIYQKKTYLNKYTSIHVFTYLIFASWCLYIYKLLHLVKVLIILSLSNKNRYKDLIAANSFTQSEEEKFYNGFFDKSFQWGVETSAYQVTVLKLIVLLTYTTKDLLVNLTTFSCFMFKQNNQCIYICV